MQKQNSTHDQNQAPPIKPDNDNQSIDIQQTPNTAYYQKLADKYFSLCNSISEGFCIIQFVLDENGEPIEWIFNEVNQAFEKHTGLPDVTGKSSREIESVQLHRWLKLYRQMLNGSASLKFLEFSKKLGKWFEGSAFVFGEPEEHLVAVTFNDVTEKKRAEDELRESKKRYQALIESNIDFVWEMDKYGTYTYCSPQVEKLWGYKPEDFIGRSTFDFMPAEEKERAGELFKNAVFSPKDFAQFESVSYNKKNEIVYVETSGSPFFDESGELLGFRGITRDITWRKIAGLEFEESRKALNASETKFRSIVETANEGVCLLNENLIITYVNNKLSEMSGFSIDELTGKSVFEFLKKRDRARLKKIVDKQTGNEEFNLVLGRKDGSTVTVLAKTSIIRNEQGKPAQYLGMLTDISSMVAIERDLKKTKKKLEIALDNGKIGTWEWDIRTNEVVWDRRMEEMFNLEPGTFGGAFSSFESYVHEEDLPHVKNAISESLYEGKPYAVVYRTRPVDGKSHYISSKALLMRSSKGNPICLSGVAFDITDMKEGAEKVLIKLNEELLRSNADLRQFAGVASHDLQEPLRMVSSYTQLLRQKYKDSLDQDALDYINYAVEGSKRMYEMINGLLAYSRVNIRETEFKSVDMNVVLKKVMDNLGLLIKNKNAVILSEKLPVVSADENQMVQLLQNIIENSLKFCNTIPRVEISSSQEGNNFVISVKDNGIGIESQYFERIFRIFQKLHTREKFIGAGIGLAICRRIIERHSGKIRVKSEPGKGSTFIVTIPVR